MAASVTLVFEIRWLRLVKNSRWLVAFVSSDATHIHNSVWMRRTCDAVDDINLWRRAIRQQLNLSVNCCQRVVSPHLFDRQISVFICLAAEISEICRSIHSISSVVTRSGPLRYSSLSMSLFTHADWRLRALGGQQVYEAVYQSPSLALGAPAALIRYRTCQ